MDKKTQKALESSIKKWRDIVKGDGKDEGTLNCSLCKEFYDFCACQECPVKMDTGKDGCKGTPYEEWINHQARRHPDLGMTVHCYECKAIATEMVVYLRSLREMTKYYDGFGNVIGKLRKGYYPCKDKPKAPEKKVVDLSMLEGNDWLLFNFFGSSCPKCEGYLYGRYGQRFQFKRGVMANGKLDIIDGHDKIELSDRLWYPWFGGDCPLPEGVMVEVKYRDGDILKHEAIECVWQHGTALIDIIAFRVVGLADGWKYGWEV